MVYILPTSLCKSLRFHTIRAWYIYRPTVNFADHSSSSTSGWISLLWNPLPHLKHRHQSLSIQLASPPQHGHIRFSTGSSLSVIQKPPCCRRHSWNLSIANGLKSIYSVSHTICKATDWRFFLPPRPHVPCFICSFL